MQTKRIQAITIDLYQTTMIPLPQFIQNDTNIIEFTIKENGVAADLSNIGRIVVNYQRSDKKRFSRLLTAVGETISYEIGLEEMEVSGHGEVELQFFSSDNLEHISTKRFKVQMLPSIGTDILYENDGNLTLLQELFVEVESLVADTEAAADHAQTQGDYAKAQGDYVESKKPDIDKFTSEQNNLQEQINQLVVDGDSSPEAAQARVDGQGNSYTTLKQRLDSKDASFTSQLADKATKTEVNSAKAVSDKTLRPITLAYDYEKSPSKLYPNFLKRLESGDLTKLKVVFVGNSHTAGQGATETGGEKVPELKPPSGVTDGFHKRDASSGVFVDKIARKMEKAYGLSITKRIVAANETTYYNLRTGTWTQATDTRMTDASGAAYIQSSSTIGDSLTKQLDSTNPQRCATFHFAKLPSGGTLDVLIKTNNPVGLSGLTRNDASVWKKPSEIEGLVRSDGAIGTAMDTVDLYNSTGDYTYSLGFTFPFFANWQIKFTVSANKNAASSGNLCVIGTSVLDHENFVNAGRGNHTILDYLGNTVTKGAGGSGNLDHTDHLAEVLALNPSLIILEPMVINDWFHGVNVQDTTSCLQEMIRRIKKANCDVLVITPAPCVTTDVPLDYNQHPDYATNPPLTNNLNGLGSFEVYIDVILKVAYWERVPVINNYKYFLERFYKADHQNWTLGTNAGRIHVNQHGHDIYADGIIQFSGLFPATINTL